MNTPAGGLGTLTLGRGVPSAGDISHDVAALAIQVADNIESFASRLRCGGSSLTGRPTELATGSLLALAARTGDAASEAQFNSVPARPEAELFGVPEDEVVVYDAYFGLTRSPTASQAALTASAIPTLTLAIATVPKVRITTDAMADIADLITDLVRGSLTGTPIPAVGSIACQNLCPQPVATDVSPLTIWKLGHQIYGLSNRWAARHLILAKRAFVDRDRESTTAHLISAGRAVAGLTGGMEMAAAMTSFQYATEVRPTMAPPHTAIELTGRQNTDHTAYRRALADFLTVCPDSFADLASVSTPLAHARDSLLSRDLADINSHVALTYRLVGERPSLDERDDGSAVQRLRSIEVDRVQIYSGMLRLGPRTARHHCPDPNAHQDGHAA